MLNSKQHTQIYIYSCDNTLKFKKNEEGSVTKIYLRNVSKYFEITKIKVFYNKC